ncbi:MAG: type I toxin-antitoxin system SymE family toxin [Prevotellaceae bacterium]|jgi:hypothetical protein|nr:type I toxin-antitoxin system SymE family toxin [Prevotellaceae bacterium]
MLNTKSQSKTNEPNRFPTFKRVIQKQIEEESVTLRAEEPKVRYIKLQPFYRRLTGWNYSKVVSHLRLCGNWLEAAGFHAEEYVSVTVMSGLMIIRTAREE